MLDTQSFADGLKSDLVNSVSQTLAGVEQPLIAEMRSQDQGLQFALRAIRERAEKYVADGGPSEGHAAFIQAVVAEEFAKAISGKMVKVLIESWLPAMADAISQSVSDRVDAFVRGAEVVVPAGQPVEVSVSGENAGKGQTTQDAGPILVQ